MEAVKYSPKELYLRCYSRYGKRESISVILWHVEAFINSLKILKNYLWRSSDLTKFIKRWGSFKAKFWTNRFSRLSHIKVFTKIHSRTSSTLFYDNFAYLPTFENWNAGGFGGIVNPPKGLRQSLVGIPGSKAPESWMKVPILA